jgi:DNA invertase Pin-like site-specific DNA recombinase
MAEQEGKNISARTKAALAAAKARGVVLRNPKQVDARPAGWAANRAAADAFAANVLPIIEDIKRSGVRSLRGIAAALAARGIKTARGGAWTPVHVSNLLRRGKWTRRLRISDQMN